MNFVSMSTHAPSTKPAHGRTLRLEQFETRLVLSAATAIDLSAASPETLHDGSDVSVFSSNLASLSVGEGGLIHFYAPGKPSTVNGAGGTSGFVANAANSQEIIITDGSLSLRLSEDFDDAFNAGDLDLDGTLNFGVNDGWRSFPTTDPPKGEGGRIPLEIVGTSPVADPGFPEQEKGDTGEGPASIAALTDRPLENVRVRAYWLEVAASSQAAKATALARDVARHPYLQEAKPSQRGQHLFAAGHSLPTDASRDHESARSTGNARTGASATVAEPVNKQQSRAAGNSHDQTLRPQAAHSAVPSRAADQTTSEQAARHAAFEEIETNPRTEAALQAHPVAVENERQASSEHSPHLYGMALIALLSADHFLRRHSQSEGTTVEPPRRRRITKAS